MHTNRRADPPLVSEEAQKRMIVLDTRQRGMGETTKSNSDAGKGSGQNRDAQNVESALRSNEDLPDALYQRHGIHMEWPSVRKVGTGLANLGNTCFLNAVTQCLTHTPPLAAFCLNGEHKKYGAPKNGGSGFNAVYEMGEHIVRALQNNGGGRSVAPVGLVKNLRAVSKTFRKVRQEDAHEFARCLLDAMHKKACESARPVAKEGSARSETSFVWQVFGGKLRSRVTCLTCNRCSDKFDGFMDLSLDIAKAKSVANALKSYVAVEVLDGRNKYKCEMGPGKAHMARATKQFTVDQAPLVLTIQLKRFEYVPFGRGKLNQFVEYPLELDLSHAMSGAAKQSHAGKKSDKGTKVKTTSGSDENYQLFGVVVHSGGSMHSGHYYCYVKGATGLWYEMDDEGVTQCGEKAALTQRAYLLFYAKTGTGLCGKRGGDDAAAVAAAHATRVAAKRANLEQAAKREAAVAKALAEEKKALATEDRTKALSTKAERARVGDSTPKEKKKFSKNVALGSPTEASGPTLERHVGLRSPVGSRGGKLLSSRDSARLRLFSSKMKRTRGSREGRFGAPVSPVKTRAARLAEQEGTVESVPSRAVIDDLVPSASDDAQHASTTSRPGLLKKGGTQNPPPSLDAKSVKKWLNREARDANVVGRGGGRGWDDTVLDGQDVLRGAKKEKSKSHAKEPSAPGRDEFSRKRSYDDADEEYDRGKVSKHARRKEDKKTPKRKPPGSSSSSKKRNPFQSKAKSKSDSK